MCQKLSRACVATVNRKVRACFFVQIGVELDEKGGVKVDDFSHSNVASIWAIGDVTNRIPLTPVARMEGTYFAQHLFG